MDETPSPSRGVRPARRRVAARRIPTPPRAFWIVLGLAVVGWGLVRLRARSIAQNPDPLSLARVVVTAETSERPVLAPLTPIAAPHSGDPPALDPVDEAGPQAYVVAPGDTLSSIADRFAIPLEELLESNGLTNPNFLQVGQTLQIPGRLALVATRQRLLPDSELIYSPAYATWNSAAFVAEQGGYLATHREVVDGVELSGVEILEHVAQRYGVGPRPLLALLEYQSGWVTQPEPEERRFPIGERRATLEGLHGQLEWAANRLNEGYYNQTLGRQNELRFPNGTRALVHQDTGAASAAVQNVFALLYPPDAWSDALAADGFAATYRALFGDPWPRAIEPLVPVTLAQPELALPWPSGETWYLTGGPHGGWGELSAPAALDFVPPDNSGCAPSTYIATAAAAGKVIRSESGEVVIDLDGDGFVGTGWTLLYMHMATPDRVALGSDVAVGDPIGRPSCEGGFSDAAHLHIARRYNGQWIPAAGEIPFTLGDWEARPAERSYDGYMVRGDETREACVCRSDEINGLSAP